MLDAGCCGMAGSFGYRSETYDLSVAMAKDRLLPAVTANPGAIVVAQGTSCRSQIADLAARRAVHPAQLLADQLAVISSPAESLPRGSADPPGRARRSPTAR
jgi:Fe-S oxidoreductase